MMEWWTIVQTLRQRITEPARPRHAITIEMLNGDPAHDWPLIGLRFPWMVEQDLIPKRYVTSVTGSSRGVAEQNTSVTSFRSKTRNVTEDDMPRVIYNRDGWRHVESVNCDQCGKEIVNWYDKGPLPKYCSNACRQKAYRQRKRKTHRRYELPPATTRKVTWSK